MLKRLPVYPILVLLTLTVLAPRITLAKDRPSSGGSAPVSGYRRSNGTYVAPHHRSRPDGNFSNNWSTRGNVNPYTGKLGTKVSPHTGGAGSYTGGLRIGASPYIGDPWAGTKPDIGDPAVIVNPYVDQSGAPLPSIGRPKDAQTRPLAESSEDAKLPAMAVSLPAGEEAEGIAIRVHDGDTLTLLIGKTQYGVRLWGVDAPELGQPFGAEAQTALSEKVLGKTVEVWSQGFDKYGRTLGIVGVRDDCVNTEMVRRGLAWHYKSQSDEALAEGEKESRASKAGLWSDPNPIAPWDWRATAAKDTSEPLTAQSR